MTYPDVVSKARSRLGAGGADVVPNAGVLAGRTVDLSHRAGAVGSGETTVPGRVGAYWGSRGAIIRLSTVAIQDWCAENKAGYEALGPACRV